MLRVRAGMGGVGNICILMCECAQLGARRRTGMFRGAVCVCSDISALESVFPFVRSWNSGGEHNSHSLNIKFT